jgi:RHS repeat-associated protein
VTTYHYDASGYVEWIRDPLGREVRFTYDAAGRVLTQRLPDLRQLQFEYDANGNLTSITPPGRPAHLFDHTPTDLGEMYDPPEVGLPEDRTLYAYNADSQLELVTRPDGQTIDYVYGASSGRLDSMVSPRGSHLYEYHPTSGNLTSVTDPDGGALAFTYDGSLPTSVTWTGPVAGSVAFAYDNDFELVSRTVNGVDAVVFGYDDDGLLTSAGDLQLTRAPSSGFLEGSTLGTTTDALSYTQFGELDAFTARTGGAPVLTYDLDRDAGGRITKKTETIGGATSVWEYRYDAAGRLDEVKKDSVVVETYGYDTNSNRTSWTDFWGTGAATYDDQDRLLTYGGTSYTYTANGELLTKTAGPETTTYGYDVFGNLRTVSLPAGMEIEYLIDAANRRVGKKVNGVLVKGFLYQSQLQPAAELDGAGSVVATFVYATKSNVPDYMVRGGATYRIFTDHLGSVRLVVNTADGTVAQRLDYDAFGRVMLDTNAGFQPFGFAGGLYDYQTGLVRFGARDYDAETGRWTARDPIGFAGGNANLYGHVLGDPVNLLDPDGRWALVDDAAFVLGGAVLGLAGQAVGDIISGERSSWHDYLASAVGGAAGGATLLYTANPWLAGGATGLVGNFTRQMLARMDPCYEFSFRSLAQETGLGVASGGLAGRAIPRLSQGRNSWAAIFRSNRTKLMSGTISSVQPTVAAKMFVGAAWDYGLVAGTFGVPAGQVLLENLVP